MTTNRDWLFSLPLEEQYAWMNAEHVETANTALDGDTAALDAKFDGDSREKLEADVRVFSHHMYTSGEMYHKTLAFLDRQAAITERHWMEIVGASANANVELKRQIDELTAERDEWKHCCKKAERERETYRNLLGAAFDHAEAIINLGWQVDEGAA